MISPMFDKHVLSNQLSRKAKSAFSNLTPRAEIAQRLAAYHLTLVDVYPKRDYTDYPLGRF